MNANVSITSGDLIKACKMIERMNDAYGRMIDASLRRDDAAYRQAKAEFEAERSS